MTYTHASHATPRGIFRLQSTTGGVEPGGAGTRIDPPCWRVRLEARDGTTHGQAYRTPSEALIHWFRVTRCPS